jgi:hypothetical protein
MKKETPHTIIDVAEVGGKLKPHVSFSAVQMVEPGRVPIARGQKPTMAPTPPDRFHRAYKWASWGSYDDLPTIIRQKVNQVPIAGRTVYDLVRMATGDGLSYYFTEQRQQEAYHQACLPARGGRLPGAQPYQRQVAGASAVRLPIPGQCLF